MKRILLFTLIILFTFIGCTKLEPEQESSTAISTVEETLSSHSKPETAETSSTYAIEESSRIQSITVTNKAASNITTKAALTAKEEKSTAVETSTKATTQATTYYITAATTAAATTTASSTAAKTTATVQTSTESSGLDIVEPTTTVKPTEKATTAAQITVTVVCNCKNAVEYGIREEKTFIPESGIILSTAVTLEQGSTAMDAIKAACTQSSVEIKETRGYIRSIGSLAEKDCGGASGWLYCVNGSFPNTSSDKYVLEANDCIELHYTVKNGDVVRM